MESQNNLLQQIDWNVLIPILTFFLGLSYSYFDKLFDKRREKKNMLTMLFRELVANYKHIYGGVGEFNKELSGDKSSLNMFEIYTESLSFEVYDAYLEKLATLTQDEVTYIYFAYERMRMILNYKRFMAPKASDEIENKDQLFAVAMYKQLFEKTSEGIELALSVYGETGDEFLRRYKEQEEQKRKKKTSLDEPSKEKNAKQSVT